MPVAHGAAERFGSDLSARYFQAMHQDQATLTTATPRSSPRWASNRSFVSSFSLVYDSFTNFTVPKILAVHVFPAVFQIASQTRRRGKKKKNSFLFLRPSSHPHSYRAVSATRSSGRLLSQLRGRSSVCSCVPNSDMTFGMQRKNNR